MSCALVLGQRVDRLEWLEQVRSAFAAEGVDCLPIRRTSVRDHRSGRRQHAVTLSTRFYRELLAERRRWYPGGTKVVPTDLSLTPTTLAHWYWGDGHCSHAKSVGLATNAFPIPDVMRLVAEIKARWGWHARVSASGTGPVIMISRREDVRALFDLVRPMAPSCFKYKVPEVPDDGGKTRSERYGRSAFVGRSLNAAQVRDLRLKRSHGARWCDLGREFGIQPNTVRSRAGCGFATWVAASRATFPRSRRGEVEATHPTGLAWDLRGRARSSFPRAARRDHLHQVPGSRAGASSRGG